MRGWRVVLGLLLTLCALPVAADEAVPASIRPPVTQWSKGDWWEAQIDQQALTAPDSTAAWLPSFRMRFVVTQVDEKEVRVEVTTLPENRFQQQLALSYT